MLRWKKLLVVGLATALLGVAACSSDDGAGSSDEASEKSSESGGADGQSVPGADLEGIPEVVAEVDGEEITRDEFVEMYERQFEQMAMQAQAGGQEPDQDALKEQVAQSLVNTELLTQAAADQGLEATDADVDQTIEELATSNGMSSPDEFLKALDEQGVPEDEVRDQVATQVKVDALIAEEGGDLDPTQGELRKAYDQAVAQQKQAGGKAADKLPPFKKVVPQLTEQVTAQKEAAAGEELVGRLRKDADIEIFL